MEAKIIINEGLQLKPAEKVIVIEALIKSLDVVDPEIEQDGLGNRFDKEIKTGIERIKQFPLAWLIERPEIRRYLLHRFP